MVVTYDLRQPHALVQVVTIITRKPYQLLVINLVTTQNQQKQSTKHVYQDLDSPFQLLIHLRMRTKIQSHIHGPLQLIQNTKTNLSQSTNIMPKISIQLSNSIPQGELSLESQKATLGQYKVYILNQPIHSDLIYHFAYQLPSEISSRTCHLYNFSTS